MILQLICLLLIYSFVIYASHLVKKFIRNFRASSFIRTVLFFATYILPLLLLTIKNEYVESAPQVSLLIGISLAVIPSIIAIIIQLDSYKIFFQKDIYYFLKPITLEHFLLVEASLIGSATSEELFYRFFSYNLMTLWSHAPLVVITSILFSFSHYLQKETRETFILKSYIIIFLLGCSWFYSFLYTQNILFPILGHFLYNLPNIIIAFFKFYLPAKFNGNAEGTDPK